MSKSRRGNGTPAPSKPTARDGKIPARIKDFDPLVHRTAVYIALSSDYEIDRSGGGVAPPHVADMLGCTKGAAQNALNRLVEKGQAEKVWGTVPDTHRPRQSYVMKTIPRFETEETAEYSSVIAHNHDRLRHD